MDEQDEKKVLDLSNPEVVTKYNTAAEIANRAMTLAMSLCVEGADVSSNCAQVDAFIVAETDKTYTKKDKDGKTIGKGVAFPTCMNPNNICAHYSPLAKESSTLKAGDLVKIDLGVHFDGFPVCVGQTHLIPGGDDSTLAKKKDVISAAWTAAEAALRCVQAGHKSSEVTHVYDLASKAFDVNLVQGALSHQAKQHVIDGTKCIISKETVDEKMDTFEFKPYEVYIIDVLMTTGEGKPKETENRTTLFKRDLDVTYQLKTQKARQFISEVTKRFPCLPFNIRAIDDEVMARLGVSESTRHGLLDPYPVLKEKDGEFVAQFKFTCLIMAGGTKRVTGNEWAQKAVVMSEKEVTNPELKEILAKSANHKRQKKNKAKAVDEKPKEA